MIGRCVCNKRTREGIFHLAPAQPLKLPPFFATTSPVALHAGCSSEEFALDIHCLVSNMVRLVLATFSSGVERRGYRPCWTIKRIKALVLRFSPYPLDSEPQGESPNAEQETTDWGSNECSFKPVSMCMRESIMYTYQMRSNRPRRDHSPRG
jgi:hypothetical protein